MWRRSRAGIGPGAGWASGWAGGGNRDIVTGILAPAGLIGARRVSGVQE